MCRLDSTEITETHRKELLAAITAIKPQSVVVTHGTDTIIETARWLSGKLPAKIIVLTGAMLPAKFAETDAHFNIGAAVASAQLLAPGVYVCMGGMVCDPHRCSRSDNGTFVCIP